MRGKISLLTLPFLPSFLRFFSLPFLPLPFSFSSVRNKGKSYTSFSSPQRQREGDLNPFEHQIQGLERAAPACYSALPICHINSTPSHSASTSLLKEFSSFSNTEGWENLPPVIAVGPRMIRTCGLGNIDCGTSGLRAVFGRTCR